MKHSVIIPHYNQPDSLGRTLSQLARQTQPPDEIVVVDDGSDVPLPSVHLDDLGYVQEHLVIIPLVRHPRGYPQTGHAINVGVEASTGDILTVMCSNWVFGPGFCATAKRLVQLDPKVVRCGCNMGQQERIAYDFQDADNGLHYHFERDAWVPWDERFTSIGGIHHVLWWITCLQRKGYMFRYTPMLEASHSHPAFQNNGFIRMNQDRSWRLFIELLAGNDEMANQLSTPNPEEETIYTRDKDMP